jgi:hypothetical protein
MASLSDLRLYRAALIWLVVGRVGLAGAITMGV